MNRLDATPTHEEGPQVLEHLEAGNLERNYSMSTVQQYTYAGLMMRAVDSNGEPWFVTNDVCRVLGITNVGNALASLDADEKSSIHIADGTSGNPNKSIINEPGLYSLALRSRKPEARAFKRWITHEVIPAIRKTGGYQVASPEEQMAQGLLAAQQMLTQKDERIAELEPAADAWATVVSTTGTMSFRDAAKALHDHGVTSIGGQRLIDRCLDWGWVFRPPQSEKDKEKGKTPPVRAKQAKIEQGIFEHKAKVYIDPQTGEQKISSKPQVRVTGKGLDAIRKRLTGGQLEEAA